MDEELTKMPKFFGKPPEVAAGLLEDEGLKVMNKFPLFVGLFGSDARI